MRKRRQKVGYFPSACLVCASLICHDIRRIYGKRTLCNLLREGCTRAYCEIRTGYFPVTGDTGSIRVVCNQCQWCATAMHRYTKTHEYVGTRRRHVSNVGQPSGTTRGGTVLDGKLNFVYLPWPREISSWGHRWTTLCHAVNANARFNDRWQGYICRQGYMHKIEKNADLGKEICNKI